MGFKEINLKDFADELGINYFEVKEKQRLIEHIVRLRTNHGISQSNLAQMVGVSQSRISQIESGISTSKISFDVIFHILNVMGFNCEVRLKKMA